MRAMTHKWIKGLPSDFALLPKKDVASPSVTCLKVPESFDRQELRERMRKKGYLTDTGYGKLSITTIRVPHMGEVSEEMLQEYLVALEEEITLLCAPSHR